MNGKLGWNGYLGWRGHGVKVLIALLWVGAAIDCGDESKGDDTEEGGPSTAAVEATPTQPLYELSPQEIEEGWQLLFDGRTLDGWRGYGLEGLPAGWQVDDGVVHLSVADVHLSVAEGERADLLTEAVFESFDLKLEWAVAAGGNSGIFFHVSEDHRRSYETGPEYQILDNAGHRDGAEPQTSAGSNYALHAPSRDLTRPLGEFNEARIRVQGDRVEHWLNGEKILEYKLWDEDWEERVEASKFAAMPGYGLNKTGHIVLQDHGDEIWFRSIRILPLP